MDLVFKALSDPHRRKILEILKKRDMQVNEIANYFSFSGATLSHHLDILKRAHLVISQRQGQYIEYSLNTSVVEEVLKSIITVFERKKS
jgi:ArsR family transcriptional regulator, arsenate/arsenite/antimonite-responsive transcriptional repressor